MLLCIHVTILSYRPHLLKTMLVLSHETLPWWFAYEAESYLDLCAATKRTRRRGRKQPLDDLKRKEQSWKLKEEALDRTSWELALEEAMDLS